MIEGISSVGANRFLRVWDAINEYLNKNNYPWDDDNDEIKRSFDVMKALSEIDNVEEIIKTLAETGYKLPTTYNSNEVFLREESLKLLMNLQKTKRIRNTLQYLKP